MDMIFSCEKCGQRYEITQPGRYQCQCGEVFDIPVPIQPAPAAEPEPRQKQEDLIIKKPWRAFIKKMVFAFVGYFFLLLFAIMLFSCSASFKLNGWHVLLYFAITSGITVAKCYIDRMSTECRITSDRILKRSGLFAIKRTEIRISDIRGISLSQTLTGRLLKIGTIELGTAATAGVEMRIEYALEPEKIMERINQLRDISRQ